MTSKTDTKSATSYRAKVYVTLKPVVNDPQGLAILGGLHNMGYASVARVRAGKVLEIDLQGVDRQTAEKQVNEMARRLLANPVIEDYTFDLQELTS